MFSASLATWLIGLAILLAMAAVLKPLFRPKRNSTSPSNTCHGQCASCPSRQRLDD